MRVHLPRSRRRDVHGRLLQRDAPLAGVPLRLLTEASAGGEAAAATSDDRGEFRFATPALRSSSPANPAPPRGSGAARCSGPAPDRSTSATCSCRNRALSNFTAVRDRDGRAVADAGVTARRTDSRWSIAGHDLIDGVRTDANGVARLAGLCPGGWHVDVHAAGRRSGAANVEVLAEDTATADVGAVDGQAAHRRAARLA
ncbi:MAG: carboxypeptidase-like regulatory domain-containing protein [Planctomycetota bacterium]